jgi:predicted ATPase
MFNKQLRKIWDQLRSKKVQMKYFLEQVSIQELKGIKNLTVDFDYPVSVIAGPNASGKSTVLFSLACAYDAPNQSKKRYPSDFFPTLKTSATNKLSDKIELSILRYYYKHDGTRTLLQWGRKKGGWSKSYLGQKGGVQPQRDVYVKTLANLTHPSEVRSILQITNKPINETEITSDLLLLAQSIIPFKYLNMHLLTDTNAGKDILFANRGDDLQYSEFQMSSGERAVLRLSKDISKLQNALILIDEVEVGLHPSTQQILMLELQRLALRNNLQIVVTTHSSIILETVPPEARIFLERTEDNVIVQPPYRDILQKAFYGQSIDKLSILCEDDCAEGFITGVLEVLNDKLKFSPNDITVGRDTGKSEFAQHIKALGKFNRLDDFIFVGDGDARDFENEWVRTANEMGQNIRVTFLPTTQIPETWIWERITQNIEEYSVLFGIDKTLLKNHLQSIEQLFNSATDKPTEKNKYKLRALCEYLKRENSELFRIAGRYEAQKGVGDVAVFTTILEDFIIDWRNKRQ